MGTPVSGGLAPYALALLRVVAGATFLVHGYPKIGFLQGFAGFVGSLGIPLPRVVAVIVIVALLVKLPTVGLVAPPNQPGVGAELDLLLLAACLVIATAGAGALSVERVLRSR